MSSRRSTFLAGLAGVLVGALFVGAGPGLAAAVGDALRLGQTNSVSKQTTLRSAGAHVLVLENTAGGRGLRINTSKGKPPFTVNRAARVANLNADKLDGYHASDLVRLATTTATNQVSTTSSTFSDVPGTQVSVVVPSGRTRVALVEFTSVNRCSQDPVASAYCIVGLTVDGDTPRAVVFNSIRQGANNTTGADYAFASHAAQWVVELDAGAHTLGIRFRADEAGADFMLTTRTLSVLTVPKSNTSTG